MTGLARRWKLTRKGRCFAGGQGALGCGRNATIVVYGRGRMTLPSCAEHEQPLTEALAWLGEQVDHDDQIPKSAVLEFAIRCSEIAPATTN